MFYVLITFIIVNEQIFSLSQNHLKKIDNITFHQNSKKNHITTDSLHFKYKTKISQLHKCIKIGCKTYFSTCSNKNFPVYLHR
jgi:hypothetical protein